MDDARPAFAFLVEEFDFLGPHVQTGHAYLALAYTGRGVGAQVEFDAREQYVDVFLVELRDGEWPERYEPGWISVDRIASLRRESPKGGVFRTPQTEEDIKGRLEEEARLLRQVASDILRGDTKQLQAYLSTQP